MSSANIVPMTADLVDGFASVEPRFGGLAFAPHLSPKIWGRRRLATSLDKPVPLDGRYGESWEISTHAGHESQVAQGPWAGWRLPELCARYPQAMLGPAGGAFPWLVKFLDCHDPLSVQVHPNDRLAADLLGEPTGKTEAWIVMETAPWARVCAGLKSGITQADVRAALDQDRIEDCLAWFRPQVGDCVFLPAGRVHTAQGVLLAEVCQPSDATFRLFDFHRTGDDGQPRALHHRSSLAAIDLDSASGGRVVPRVWGGLPRGVAGELLVECPQFRLDRVRLGADWRVNPQAGPTVWLALAGTAKLEVEGFPAHILRRGETILLPHQVSSQGYRLGPLDDQQPPTLGRVTLPG